MHKVCVCVCVCVCVGGCVYEHMRLIRVALIYKKEFVSKSGPPHRVLCACLFVCLRVRVYVNVTFGYAYACLFVYVICTCMYM